MVGTPVVVKVGGDLLGDTEAVLRVAWLRGQGTPVVLVHGGGPQLDVAAAKAGLASHKVAGRRVTSGGLIELAKQVWRGQVSLAWVEALAKRGVGAVGLCGADGGMVMAKRRPPVSVTKDDGQVTQVDYGFVGDVTAVEPSVLHALLQADLVPIVAPLAGDVEGGVLNVNADTVAAELAIALGAAELVLLTKAPGILVDADNPDSLISEIDLPGLDVLEKEGALLGGMRPKVDAVRRALEGGVHRVRVSGTTIVASL